MASKKKQAFETLPAVGDAPKEWRYVGPRPAPRIKFPGSYQTFLADALSAEQRERYLMDNPIARYWWK